MTEINHRMSDDTFTFVHALELARKCWLPLLVSVILIFLPLVAAMVITWEGEAQAAAAKEASLAEFNDDSATLTAWVDKLEAANAANEIYNDTLRPYTIFSLGVKALGWLYTPWLLIGLYKGLLETLRGGKCTLRCLLSARSRWKTALWLSFLIGLCTSAATFAGTVLIAGLDAVLSVFGSIIGMILYVVGLYWVTLHLLLTDSHLADDAEGVVSAVDCIRYSWQDMKAYGLFSALCVVWPMLLVQEFFSLMVDFVSASRSLDVVQMVAQAICTALTYAAYAGIYEEIRRAPEAAEANVAISEGLARALASGEDSPA